MKKIIIISLITLFSVNLLAGEKTLEKECREGIGYWVSKIYNKRGGLISESSSIIINKKTMTYDLCYTEIKNVKEGLFNRTLTVYVSIEDN